MPDQLAPGAEDFMCQMPDISQVCSQDAAPICPVDPTCAPGPAAGDGSNPILATVPDASPAPNQCGGDPPGNQSMMPPDMMPPTQFNYAPDNPLCDSRQPDYYGCNGLLPPDPADPKAVSAARSAMAGDVLGLIPGVTNFYTPGQTFTDVLGAAMDTPDRPYSAKRDGCAAVVDGAGMIPGWGYAWGASALVADTIAEQEREDGLPADQAPTFTERMCGPQITGPEQVPLRPHAD